MKKFMMITSSILALLVAIIIILGFFETKVEVSKSDTITEKFDRDETFLFVLGSSTCSACNDYKAGTLKEYVNDDNDLELVFAYQDKSFSQSQYQQFMATYITPYKVYEYSPTTYIVKNGVIVADITGNITLRKLEAFISEN